ncbi:MAG: hypothetical protein ACRDQV_12790 [Pseudonocardiaceae bacterium]
MNAPEQPPETDNRSHNRRVIHATCSTHGGGAGFTNLVVSKRGGHVELNPHAGGSCVLILAEDEAIALRDTLIEWLG